MTASAVHIVQRMAPGGIETLVLDLVRSRGSSDRIYSLEGTTQDLVDGWQALAPFSNTLCGFGHRGGLSPWLLMALVRQLSADRPSAVVVHHIGPYLYGGLASRLTRTPVLVHVEHDGWHLKSPRRRLLTRQLERLLRPRHVAVSQSVAGELANVTPSADIRVVPNGIDLERFQPGERTVARRLIGVPSDVQVVGTAGRLLPVKGHHILLRAIQQLSDNVHVVIAGHGDQADALARLAKDLGIAPRVHLIGHRDDIAAILPAFDVFCLPSFNEGLPRCVIEAQACGVPVVASDVGGLREAVCASSGRLVPVADPVALADTLRSTLSTSAAISPRAFVASRFAWPSTLAAYENAMEVRHVA